TTEWGRPEETRGSLSAGEGLARDDAGGRSSRHPSHRHGGRRLAPRRVGGLDRQSGAWANRLPIRHSPAADAGKPYPARMEGEVADAGRWRRAASPLLADGL